jgi:hypothetical protein
MRKSFLQILGESVPAHIYGLDIHDVIQKQEAFRDVGTSENFIGNDEAKMKTVTEKNKR